MLRELKSKMRTFVSYKFDCSCVLVFQLKLEYLKDEDYSKLKVLSLETKSIECSEKHKQIINNFIEKIKDGINHEEKIHIHDFLTSRFFNENSKNYLSKPYILYPLQYSSIIADSIDNIYNLNLTSLEEFVNQILK